MKQGVLALLLSLFTSTMLAQPSQALEENKSVMINGIELGFRINQESTKKAGDDEYSRYVLEFYAINRNECNKYIYYRRESATNENSSESLIASFYVRNANGKRFTSTGTKVYARQWWVSVKTTEKGSDGKEVVRLREMQGGYIFRRGEQLQQKITILVPKGEIPKAEVVLQNNID